MVALEDTGTLASTDMAFQWHHQAFMEPSLHVYRFHSIFSYIFSTFHGQQKRSFTLQYSDTFRKKNWRPKGTKLSSDKWPPFLNNKSRVYPSRNASISQQKGKFFSKSSTFSSAGNARGICYGPNCFPWRLDPRPLRVHGLRTTNSIH